MEIIKISYVLCVCRVLGLQEKHNAYFHFTATTNNIVVELENLRISQAKTEIVSYLLPDIVLRVKLFLKPLLFTCMSSDCLHAY